MATRRYVMEVVLDLHLDYDRSKQNGAAFPPLPESLQRARTEPGTRFFSDRLHPDQDIARLVPPRFRTLHRTKSSSGACHVGKTIQDQDGLGPVACQRNIQQNEYCLCTTHMMINTPGDVGTESLLPEVRQNNCFRQERTTSF
jgi:hypothetical protein